jgi:hypothetical protein
MPGNEEIGHGRTHETYVFRWNGEMCPCGCGCAKPVEFDNIDSMEANSDSECAANHTTLVLKWLNAPASPYRD